MAKDYKRRSGSRRGGASQRGRSASDHTPGWVWGLGGLATGLAVAYAVHVYHTGARSPDPKAVSAAPAALAEMDPDDELVEDSPFDFYEILPDFTVEVPEDASPAPPPPGRTPVVEAAPAGSFWLQAGSFKRHADADRRKAQLALLGFGSVIQRVAVDDQTWHRVRVGPYDDPGELSNAQRELSGHDISTLRVRVKE
jgi:cell division protein FtsN